MSATTATPTTAVRRSAAAALRRLYLGRFVFAVVWAGLFVASASPIETFALALLVIYPAVDVLAAAVDTRTTPSGSRPTASLYVNIALSLAAAVGLAVVGDDIENVLLVWGAWAITTGVVQLILAAMRRSLGGQTPLIVSGAISVLAGTSFAVSASNADSVTALAGYAVLGGIFFLASALRLNGSRQS